MIKFLPAFSQNKINTLTLFIMYAMLGIAGSGYSIIVIGACLYTLTRLPSNLEAMPVPTAYKVISALGLLYYVSGVLIVMRHAGDATELLVERLPFLFFLPILLQLSLTHGFELKRAFEKGGLLAGFALGAWVLFNYLTGGGRASGGSGNPGPFATTCVFVACVNFTAFFAEPTSKRRLYFISGIFAFAGIMASGMRLFLPMLFVAPVVFALIYRKSLFDDKSRYKTLLFFIGATVTIFLGLFVFSHRFLLLYQNLQANALAPSASTSIGQRITMWTCAVETLPNNWFLGLGLQGSMSFMKACSLNLVGREISHTHFHNFAVTALLQGGVMEFLAVSLLVLIPTIFIIRFFLTLKIDDTRRFALCVWILMLSAFFLQGLINTLFGHDIHDTLFIHATCVLMAIIFARPEEMVNPA